MNLARLMLLGGALCAPLLVSGARAQDPRPAAQARLATESLTLAGSAHGRTVLAVGERGHILRSSDGGTSWEQRPCPVDIMLTGVTQVAEDQAWAVGHDAVVLHSEDGGLNWSLQYQDPELEAPLLNVLFLTARRGLAVGAYGLLLSTADGGATWTEAPPIHPDGPHIYDLCLTPRGNLLAVGEFGAILRSADQGATWEPLPSPYRGTLFGILCLSESEILIHGLRGNVFRSTDAGLSWLAVATGTEAGLYGSTVDARGRVWIVGESGLVLVSENRGRTFRHVDFADRRVSSDVLETPAGRLLTFGEQGPAPPESRPEP